MKQKCFYLLCLLPKLSISDHAQHTDITHDDPVTVIASVKSIKF